MKSVTVTLIGRAGCHLCDDADLVVSEVIREFCNVTLEHRVLDEDPQWERSYGDKIPVILVEGTEFAFWRVKPERLTQRLLTVGAVRGKN